MVIVIRNLYILTLLIIIPFCTPYKPCPTYIELDMHIVNLTPNSLDILMICDTEENYSDLLDTIRLETPPDTSISIKLNFPIYAVSAFDQSSLSISCADGSSLLDLERKLLINDTAVRIVNMDYHEFIEKTGNNYSYSLDEGACKNGFSNIGEVYIPGCGNTISVSDTFIYK